MKFLKLVVLSVMAMAAAGALYAASPSNGATIQDHKVPVDGAGVAFPNNVEIGYKVFEAFQTATAQLVVDEAGIAPTCGVLHQVCISTTASAANYAVAFDSSSASGLTGLTTGKAIMAPVNGSATLSPTCATVDAQFNKGLVLLENDATAVAYVYWRPCRGGRN